ncbi:MAG: type IV pilus modification PilV family protein [Candidatus Rokuibacteriota bacterium]
MTLAEVLAALTVLSIGLVAMVSLLPLAAFSVHEGGHRSGAAFLAAQRLEEVRHAVGFGAEAISFPDEAALAPPHAAFGRAVSVRDCGVAPGCSGVETSGIRQVTVTVTYPAAAGQGVSSTRRSAVVLSTYIGTR